MPDNTVVIDFKSNTESRLARPSVQLHENGFEMWFSRRGPFSLTEPTLRRYRLGYATSADGLSWQRCDEQHSFLNSPEPGDWDHEMQCYPNLFKTTDGTSHTAATGMVLGALDTLFASNDNGTVTI